MDESPKTPPEVTLPKQMNRHIFAVLAVLALAASVGIWVLFNQTKVEKLTIGAGFELKSGGATDVLVSEATKRELDIDIQWERQATDAIEKVDKHELDAAIVPAGLSVPADNVRQVTMLDCETLHLFVKPEIYDSGLAGLRGHTIFMGPPGTAARCAAEKILDFIGLTAGRDFIVDTRAYADMMKAPPSAMPDAIFTVSPLPSAWGDKLVRQFGYQLAELPMGEALSLRSHCFEDILIPADTYGAAPGVPKKEIHSIGVRGVLVAHSAVPGIAVEHLLEVLYEGDYTMRANLKKMDPTLLRRKGNYRVHKGAFTYMHRNDPWPVQKALSMVQGFIGSVLSIFSAILLAWQWIRRKKVAVGPYQQECTMLDLDAQRAVYQGEFGETELSACLTQLARLKAEVLEQYHQQFLSGDKQTVEVVSRIEGLQHLLPSLVRSKAPPKRLPLDFGPPSRKVA